MWYITLVVFKKPRVIIWQIVERTNNCLGALMPIFSFLVYPEKNMKDQLIKDLSKMQYCEVKPSENKDVLILLADTPDEATNKDLIDSIKELPSLQSLNMIFGHTDLD
jgi:nitrate reductase NapAB chaperone NapD